MQASISSNIVIRCKQCQSEYEMRRRDLAKTAKENKGYVPCYFCGSKDTTWDIGTKGEV